MLSTSSLSSLTYASRLAKHVPDDDDAAAASMLMWLPPTSGLSCAPPPDFAFIDGTSTSASTAAASSTSASCCRRSSSADACKSMPDTPPLPHSISGDPFAATPGSPPPLSVSVMSMAMDGDGEHASAASSSCSAAEARISSISNSPSSESSSSAMATASRRHAAPPVTLRDLLRSYNASPSHSECSSSSPATRHAPALPPAHTANTNPDVPQFRFIISTFRWKEVTEFVGDDPIVEIRPYNKSDGKRYLYVRLDGVNKNEQNVYATFHIRRVGTGEVLGFLSNRDGVEAPGHAVLLNSNLALLVNETLVRRLDQEGIGRGSPPPADHQLELVVSWRRTDHEDVEMCRLPFYRIKRRHKRSAAIRPPPAASTTDCSASAKRICGGVWSNAMTSAAAAAAADLDLHTTASSSPSSSSACDASYWLENAAASSCSPSPPLPSSSSSPCSRAAADVNAAAALCDADEASMSCPPSLDLLSASQCRQADMFLHPAMRGASAGAAAKPDSGAFTAAASDDASASIVAAKVH